MAKLREDIIQFLEKAQTSSSTTTDGLEDLVARIRIYTGFDEEIASLIVCYYFDEIKNILLRGDSINIRGYGTFKTRIGRNKARHAVFKVCKMLNKIIDRN